MILKNAVSLRQTSAGKKTSAPCRKDTAKGDLAKAGLDFRDGQGVRLVVLADSDLRWEYTPAGINVAFRVKQA